MRVENTSEREYVVHSIPKKGVGDNGHPILGTAFSIPRAGVDDKQAKVNGVGEIPDDVLQDLMLNDPWTKGVFNSGDLVIVGKAKPAEKAAEKPAKADAAK